MTTYKYTDETETLVHIVDAAGNSLKSMPLDKVPDGTVVQPAFTVDELAQRVINNANSVERATLDRLDRESIRDIREWIASQPSAPQSLKDREAQALAARARIK